MGIPRLIYSIESVAEEMDNPDNAGCVVNILSRNVERFLKEYNREDVNVFRKAALLSYNYKDLGKIHGCLEERFDRENSDSLDKAVLEKAEELKREITSFKEAVGKPSVGDRVYALVYTLLAT
jgi:hypothetical protein